MSIKKLFLGTVLAGLLITVSANGNSAAASEGEFELRNRVGEDARCVAYSILMQDLNYNILLSCRDILYPGGTSVFSYVVWAVPTDGGNHVRLGTVGLGKASFRTKTAFNALYVTKETSSNPRSPSGEVVMQGNLQVIELLDRPSLQPRPEPELGTATPEPIVTPQPRNLGNVLAAGGVLAFIALFGVILVVLVITRK